MAFIVMAAQGHPAWLLARVCLTVCVHTHARRHVFRHVYASCPWLCMNIRNGYGRTSVRMEMCRYSVLTGVDFKPRFQILHVGTDGL